MMTEGPTLVHHIRFTVGDITSMDFVSSAAEETAEFYWTKDNGQNWHYHNSLFPWLIREAGNYIISFPGKHHTPSFGCGDFAREFHSVEFLPDYHPENTDFSNMFDGCESLTSIDLGHLSPWINTSAVTNMSNVFRSPNWNAATVYQTGDVVINNGLVYVASIQSPMHEPGIYCDGWSLLKGAGTTDTVEEPEPIPIEIRESIAGIIKDTDDIPE